MVKKSDPEIWELYHEGNQNAYNALMLRYSKSLIAYGMRISQDKDIAKDCVQEVFLDLWRKRGRLGAVQAVKAYLFKCVRSRIIREQALWKPSENIEDNDHFAIEFNIETKLIEDAELREQSLKIKSVLNHLPPRQQEIMYLRFFENLDLNQISEAMNLNKQSVHNLLQKAYKSFRSEWLLLLSILPNYFFN